MKTPVFIQTILDAASLSGRHVAGLRGDFRSRLAAFRRNRAAAEQAARVEDLARGGGGGGVGDAGISGGLAGLGLRLPVFAVPMLACLITAAWSHSPVSFLSLACVAPPCLLGMVTTLWRISILRHRRFTPLCRWLLRFRKRP